MLLKSLKTFALISMLTTPLCLAQKNNTNSTNTEIGSTVLHQDGNKKYCYDNGIYTYEKVMDISNTSKVELYDRAKKWIIANLKTPPESIFFDDDNKTSITANTAIRLKDRLGITSQMVEFKLSISFKDDKVRIQGTDFVYRGVYPGVFYQKSFNDLRPFTKNLMRTIYEEFDKQYEGMYSNLTAALGNNQVDNW